MVGEGGLKWRLGPAGLYSLTGDKNKIETLPLFLGWKIKWRGICDRKLDKRKHHKIILKHLVTLKKLLKANKEVGFKSSNREQTHIIQTN